MTFNAIVPNAAQTPGIFPAQNNTNFTRLKTIISGDHQFNDTAPVPTTDGFHNRISYINQAGPAHPSIPAGANCLGYSLSVDLGTGTARNEVFAANTQGYHLLGCRAAGTWSTPGGVITNLFLYNITSLTRNGTGDYTATFSRNMPTAKYCFFGTGQFSNTSHSIDIVPYSGVDYTSAQTVGSVRFLCFRFSESDGTDVLTDPRTISILIFGG